MVRIYYNEWEPYPAAWLRNLAEAGHIRKGLVDETDIRKIQSKTLLQYDVCHFFAGIGGWEYALKFAGWPEDRPVWTGSCPCQPFSAAGKQKGFEDERHLWPDFLKLIKERRPATIFGEQVASATAWLSLVRSDLEALGYAVGAMPVQAASSGADHLRDRFWFVADDGSGRRAESQRREKEQQERTETECASDNDLAHQQKYRWRKGAENAAGRCQGDSQREESGFIDRCVHLADNNDTGLQGRRILSERTDQRIAGQNGMADASKQIEGRRGIYRSCKGFKKIIGKQAPEESVGSSLDFEWVIGADGKARRVKPGIRLLAHGISSRVAKLRALGNAIDPRPAADFIRAFLDTEESA